MAVERIDRGAISGSAFAQLLTLYPATQEAVYKAKVKDPRKLATAQKDHDWRYDELPRLIAQRRAKSSSAYLGKDELIRLTQWKIVHGQHRPFLPGMVKKNEQGRIREVTSSAFDIQADASYSESGVPEALDKALREAAQLHGVGPATATLVCSVFDPVNVAFFEDELAAWLCPDLGKLKYTWAEYKSLFTGVENLRSRLGAGHRAVDVEKVGFVVRHLDMLDAKQREAFTASAEVKSDSELGIKNEPKPSAAASLPPKRTKPALNATTVKPSSTKRKEKAEEKSAAKQDEAKPKFKRRKR